MSKKIEVIYHGKKVWLTDVIHHAQVARRTVWARLREGWTADKAIDTGDARRCFNGKRFGSGKIKRIRSK